MSCAPSRHRTVSTGHAKRGHRKDGPSGSGSGGGHWASTSIGPHDHGTPPQSSSPPPPPPPWPELPLLPPWSSPPPPWSSTVGAAVGTAVAVAAGVGVRLCFLRAFGLGVGVAVAVAVARGVSCSPAVNGSDERPIVCVDSEDAAAVTPATSRTPATAARTQSTVRRMNPP